MTSELDKKILSIAGLLSIGRNLDRGEIKYIRSCFQVAVETKIKPLLRFLVRRFDSLQADQATGRSSIAAAEYDIKIPMRTKIRSPGLRSNARRVVVLGLLKIVGGPDPVVFQEIIIVGSVRRTWSPMLPAISGSPARRFTSTQSDSDPIVSHGAPLSNLRLTFEVTPGSAKIGEDRITNLIRALSHRLKPEQRIHPALSCSGGPTPAAWCCGKGVRACQNAVSCRRSLLVCADAKRSQNDPIARLDQSPT